VRGQDRHPARRLLPPNEGQDRLAEGHRRHGEEAGAALLQGRQERDDGGGPERGEVRAAPEGAAAEIPSQKGGAARIQSCPHGGRRGGLSRTAGRCWHLREDG